MRIVSTINSDQIVYGDQLYKVAPDGTFEVPEEVGRDLVSYPHFDEEYVAQMREADRQRAEDNDVVALGRRVRVLEEQVAGLLAADKPKRHRRTKAEIEADRAAADEPDEPDADDE